VGVLSVAGGRTFELFVNPSNLAFVGPLRSILRVLSPAPDGIPTLIHVGERDD
jgi:hypothetical protein